MASRTGSRFVALLRGINVGGNNLIRMTALKSSFEGLGFRDVRTYIQSGNVLFSAPSTRAAELTRQIEERLSETFRYEASVVLRSEKQMREIVGRAPSGFGTEPDRYRYDVLFLKPPVTATSALRVVPVREEVDQVAAGPGVLYYWRLISRATQSRLSRVVSMPIYQSMTIRNWNTTTRLTTMLDELTG